MSREEGVGVVGEEGEAFSEKEWREEDRKKQAVFFGVTPHIGLTNNIQ